MRDLPRSIGFWGAAGVMVAVIIGSGIFRTPPEIAKHLDSGWVILGMWVAGGVIALCGALTFAELATMFPRSGGVYVFLREGYGDAMAFTFGWSYVLLIKPFAAGGIAVVFAEHFNPLVGFSLNPKVETCVVLIALTAINAWGTGLSARLALMLTILKASALAAIVAVAAGLGHVSAGAVEGGGIKPVTLAGLVAVMSGIMWTYDGWSDVGAVAGEVRQPQRTLPRVFLMGTLCVTVLYVLVNAAYMGVVPLAEMREMETVAPAVMERLIGSAGADAVTVVILVSVIGSSHASILTGARVTFAQSRDGLMFRFLGAVGERQTPHVALWTQCLLSCTAVMALGKFQSLADGFVFCMWVFYGLAAASVVILRVRRPGVARPYRCPGYPVVPVVFVLCAAGMTTASIASDPARTLPWLGVLVLGWPVFLVWRSLGSRREA